jgi:hypothetical protein
MSTSDIFEETVKDIGVNPETKLSCTCSRSSTTSIMLSYNVDKSRAVVFGRVLGVCAMLKEDREADLGQTDGVDGLGLAISLRVVPMIWYTW